MKITGRTSSITNAFINSIIPVDIPTKEQITKALEVLEMDPINVRCVYCGDSPTEWDHLNPLVKGKRATGYVSEIANLVPACGKCNQSKGNQAWKTWMKSSAPKSPFSRVVPDLDGKIARIERYEAQFQPSHHDFESIVGQDLWEKHWSNHERIIEEMKLAQELASKLRETIRVASVI